MDVCHTRDINVDIKLEYYEGNRTSRVVCGIEES
jgi:hypothetical protein